jgi:aminomethyltransferase
MHKEMQARIVPFAGYQMPVSYPLGTIQEHLHCRKSVGLFDVSHMGQVRFRGKHARDLLERVSVVDTEALGNGQASLSMLMLESGCIKDDCIITKLTQDDFYVVFNGACKITDLAHIQAVKDSEFKGKDVSIEHVETRSLLAVQGPKSQGLVEQVLGLEAGRLDKMSFMECIAENPQVTFKGKPIILSRCGYTGEDGFEVSVINDDIEDFTKSLLEPKGSDGQIAQMIGLGARDSLRLEAGLCLYGHDINEQTTPIEGVLAWTISKRRREQGGFLGYETVSK